MAESQTHARLVQAIVSWIAQTPEYCRGIVLVDSEGSMAGARPPAVNNYVPDVYVSGSGKGAIMIGEAKTARDLERPHSQAQLVAFLTWCAHNDDSLLVVAVPWYMTRAARNMLKYLQRRTGADGVSTTVLDGLAG